MEKYLYLTHHGWVEPWVSGGKVPLSQASSYLSEARDKIYTPDENIIDNSTHSKNQFPSLRIEGACRDVKIGEIIIDNKVVASNVSFDIRYEDGLVLCLANRRSNYIAKRLGKVACVRILDVNRLKKVLDEQIGLVSEAGECKYTKYHLRNHFLKSHLDSWQDEFRLFWKNANAQEVVIPPGIAVQERIRCR
ncbi:hypothetical protein N4T24_002508 [Salmonella enterica]|nr:hypothetical protein [Salmonella enterica]EJU2230270.1 hypothetical protein [Salmonella enterica]